MARHDRISSRFIGIKVKVDVFEEYRKRTESDGVSLSEPIRAFIWNYVNGAETVLPKRKGASVGEGCYDDAHCPEAENDVI